MTKKNTRRALFTSCISILLCVSMLIGSTFAWFTDTDTTSVNKIVAGNLDVEIVDEDGNEKKTALSFRNVEGKTDILWEPGAAFKTETFAIKNNGDLALKFKVALNNTEVSYNKLNEVIKFTLHKADDDSVIDIATYANIELLPSATSDEMYIKGYMDENAGNEYQGLTLDGVSITVYATQQTYEKDMTDDTYDKDAEIVIVNSATEMNDAITNTTAPVVLALSDNTYEFPKIPMGGKEVTFTGTTDTVIDCTYIQTPMFNNILNADIVFDGVTVDFSDNNEGYQGLKGAKKIVFKDCTITGTQFLYADTEFINCKFINKKGYNVWTYGQKTASFKDCTFETGGRAILVYNEETASNFVADIKLENCTFISDGSYYAANPTKPKAAVETGSNANNTAASNRYNLTFTNCTVDGNYQTNNSTSALWGNKNSMDADHLSVVIDGKKVY